MSTRFCKACAGWHDLGEPWPAACVRSEPPARSTAVPAPMVISDTMDPTEHIDGKRYTSKSAFRRVTKQHGCIEVGDDPARLRPIRKPKPDSKAIAEAVARAQHMVENGIPARAAS
ncbi:hypothetical protein FHS55_002639 [Angulomicrobium tetraedrale]|uniref:Uncharacterized protein n=1 Tax=Ancylobacter tetraedralis TaxID=217068 RepID=A0A839ZB70_9HYPH|nr:hypothetical protein [Ancylobacter tetraedralis]MBB3772030.1 hypothetical protein [Ancylobacter tetraedralis]